LNFTDLINELFDIQYTYNTYNGQPVGSDPGNNMTVQTNPDGSINPPNPNNYLNANGTAFDFTGMINYLNDFEIAFNQFFYQANIIMN
jgi:hypothetical protein